MEKAVDALSEEFETLTGAALPKTRDGLVEFVAAIDLADAANEDLILGINALAPALEEYADHLDKVGNEMDKVGNEIEQLVEQDLSGLADMMRGIREETASILRTGFANEMAGIRAAMEEAESAAREWGATELELAEIHELAALRARDAISSLRTSLSDLVHQLYGDDLTGAIAAEQARVNSDRTIGKMINSMMLGDLSTLSASDQLNTAESLFNTSLSGGDAGAIVSAAQEYLTVARDYFSSGDQYKAIFTAVNQALTGTLNNPLVGGAADPSALQALQAQAADEAEERAAAERAAMFQTLLQSLSEYGFATGQNLWDMVGEFGIDLQSMADDWTLALQAQTNTLDSGLSGIEGITADSDLKLGDVRSDIYSSLANDSAVNSPRATLLWMEHNIKRLKELQEDLISQSWDMHHLNNDNRTWNRQHVVGAVEDLDTSINRNLDNAVGVYFQEASVVR